MAFVDITFDECLVKGWYFLIILKYDRKLTKICGFRMAGIENHPSRHHIQSSFLPHAAQVRPILFPRMLCIQDTA